jgi:hypothetical protein
VQTISLENLLAFIESAEGRATAACLVPPGVVAADGAASLARARASELFVLALFRLFEAFRGPDEPRENAEQASNAGLHAMWDFDYYQVSLSVRDDGADSASVVVAVHEPP